jgi:predicted dehydrogenase
MADATSEPRLKAVVVGTRFGITAHVPALELAGYEVLALVGQDQERTERRAERAGIARAFTSLAEAIDLGPDVVAIASDPASHFPLSAQAVGAGCHVVCEKPFTLTVAQARELAAEADNAKRIAYLAHEFRFTPGLALFGRTVAEGAIGQPRFATLVSLSPLVADPEGRRPDWWFDPLRGGGWLGASGSHGIDLIRFWFGEFEAVSCRLGVTSDRPRDVADDSFTISFAMRSGLQGIYQSTAGAWGETASVIRVSGARGSAWVRDVSGMGIIEAAYGPVLVADPDGTRELAVPAELTLKPHHHKSWAAESIAAFRRLYETLADDIAGRPRRPGPRPATFHDGVAAMTVMDACHRSSADGGRWVAVES